MKKQMNKLKGTLKWVIALSMLGFCTAAQAQIVVNLNVNANESKLEITTRGACSSAPNKNGCVQASGVTQINYNLTGPATCSAGGQWALQQVRVSPINSQVAADFNANASSGIVTPVSQSARHILIRDQNAAAYTVNYTVTATCGGRTINSDPRVINDGTGHP